MVREVFNRYIPLLFIPRINDPVPDRPVNVSGEVPYLGIEVKPGDQPQGNILYYVYRRSPKKTFVEVLPHKIQQLPVFATEKPFDVLFLKFFIHTVEDGRDGNYCRKRCKLSIPRLVITYWFQLISSSWFFPSCTSFRYFLVMVVIFSRVLL